MKYFKCGLCGNIATLLVDKGAPLMCCGKNMDVLVANTVDASVEKHVPVVSRCKNRVTVKVGSVMHPNDEGHHVSFIALHSDAGVQFVSPPIGSEPIAVFNLQSDDKVVAVYEYCNLHGLWKTEVK